MATSTKQSLFATISNLNPLLRIPRDFYESLPIPKFKEVVSFRYRITRRNISSFRVAAAFHNRPLNKAQVDLYLREILEGRWNWSQSSIKVCRITDWVKEKVDPEEEAIIKNALREFKEKNPDDLVPEFWVVDGQHRLAAIDRYLNEYEDTNAVDVQLTVNVEPSTFLKESNLKRTTSSHLQATGRAHLAIIRPIRVAAIGGCKSTHIRRTSEEAEAAELAKYEREARAFQSYKGTDMWAKNCNSSSSYQAIGFLLYVQPKKCWTALQAYAAEHKLTNVFKKNCPSPDSLIPHWERLTRAIAARFRANNTDRNDSVKLAAIADKLQGPAGQAAGQYARAITQPHEYYTVASITGTKGKQFTYRLAEVALAWWILGRKIPKGRVLTKLTDADGYKGILPTLPQPKEV